MDFNDIKKLAINKRLNFLIGSGTSSPSISLMGNVTSENYEEIVNKIVSKASYVSKCLIDYPNHDTKNLNVFDFQNNYEEYKNFVECIINILNSSNSRITPKDVNIFTTNYDLFLERAIQDFLNYNNIVFNDGSKGYFKRILDSSNFNKVVSYRGLNDNYIDEIPSITLVKPHGSVNWEQDKKTKMISVKNHVVDNPVIVPPNHKEGESTFLSNHFHDMLRVFQLELDKPQSLLITIGFSFQDDHIAKMIRRALQNMELIIFCFCYKNEDKNTFLTNLHYEKAPNNLKIITPSELGEDNITLKVLNEILGGKQY